MCRHDGRQSQVKIFALLKSLDLQSRQSWEYGLSNDVDGGDGEANDDATRYYSHCSKKFGPGWNAVVGEAYSFEISYTK